MLARYKTRFQIRPLQDDTPAQAAETCITFIESWVARRNDNQLVEPVEEFDRESSRPQLRRLKLECGAFLHSFRWSKAGTQEDATRWVTLIDLISDGVELDFQLQLGIEMEYVALQGSKPVTGRPQLIPTLLGYPHWTCLSDGQPLSVQPISRTAREIESLCDSVLFSGSRELPVIVITPTNNQAQFPVNPITLAERLGGTAKVFKMRDALATSVLDQYLGKTLAIGMDAIRVFSPGLEPGASDEAHWHFLGETIRKKKLVDRAFADFLFQKLAELALPRFRESPLFMKFRRLGEKERKGALEQVKAAQSRDQEYYEEYATTLDFQNQQLEAERRDILNENQRLKEQVEQLQLELEKFRENITSLSAELGRPVVEYAEKPVAPERFQTVPEVVQSATSFKNLVILESARESAIDVPVNYKFTDRVLEALKALQQAAERRNQSGRLGSGWKQIFEELGFEYKANISDTTKNNWGHEYQFHYEGKRLLFEEHFTIGVKSANTCLSIYFSTKLRQDAIVVAYVGRHLRTTQT